MVETASMTAVEREAPKALTLIDCDVHNAPNSFDELLPFLPERWQSYARQSGFKGPPGPAYPKGFENAARRDAWPGAGKVPGGDPDFARSQLLDCWEVNIGMIGRDDFLLFATDYPHWDFDSPDRAIPAVVSGDLRRGIMADNAAAWYDFG